MAGPVVFNFKASGEKDVVQALDSITRAANRYKAAAEDASAKAAKAAQVAADKMKAAAEAPSKAATKAAEVSAKAAERAANAAVKASDRATEHVLRNSERQAKAAERQAVAAEKLSARKAKAEQKAGQRSDDKFASSVASVAGGALLAGAAVVGAAAREAMKLEELANRVSVNGRGYGQKSVDPIALRKSFEATAIATPGITSEEVGAGAQAFVARTGRLDIAQSMQSTFATTASATGSKVEEIATAAADLFEKFDIKSVKEMQEAFAKLSFQGKEGAFELKDAASQYAKIASAASRFNIGKGALAVATLGGLTQISRRANGSPEEAATAVEHMFTQLIAKSPELTKKGVKVFNKDGTTRNIQDVLVDTISGVGKGDMAKKKVGLQDIFGERGIRAISPLISIFEEAFQKSKKGGGSESDSLAAGQKALREEFEKTINVASSWSEVQKDAAATQVNASAQLNAAWEKLKSSVAESLIPALLKLAPVVSRLADMLPHTSTKSGKELEGEYSAKDKELRDKQQGILDKGVPSAADFGELSSLQDDRDTLNSRYHPTAARGVVSQAEMQNDLERIGKEDYANGLGVSNPIAQLMQFKDREGYNKMISESTASNFAEHHDIKDIKNLDGNLSPGQQIYVQQQQAKADEERAASESKAKAQESLDRLSTNAGKAADGLEGLLDKIVEMNKNTPLSNK
jgi:hypothetical protein